LFGLPTGLDLRDALTIAFVAGIINDSSMCPARDRRARRIDGNSVFRALDHMRISAAQAGTISVRCRKTLRFTASIRIPPKKFPTHGRERAPTAMR
jgi:hypothetical protein